MKHRADSVSEQTKKICQDPYGLLPLQIVAKRLKTIPARLMSKKLQISAATSSVEGYKGHKWVKSIIINAFIFLK